MRASTASRDFLDSRRFASGHRGTDPAVDGEDIFQDAVTRLLELGRGDILAAADGSGPLALAARDSIYRKFSSRDGTTGKRERGRGLAVQLEEAVLATDESPPDAALEASDLDGCLSEALSKLSEARREVLVLHHLRGLSVREVADALERPEGTVRTDLHRGRKQLRSELAGVDS